MLNLNHGKKVPTKYLIDAILEARLNQLQHGSYWLNLLFVFAMCIIYIVKKLREYRRERRTRHAFSQTMRQK